MSVSGSTLASVVRTLMAAGYRITDAARQPSHVELSASRRDELGIDVQYLFALCANESFTGDQIDELRIVAARAERVPVFVEELGQPTTITTQELLRRLGGEIPSWRALSADYSERLVTLSRNELPPAVEGEAWRHFEHAVNDGLEFLFGRRVRRLGGGNPGSRLPDAIASMAAEGLLLVDSKATRTEFDASAENLRAIQEYATQQIRVQQGSDALVGCLIVSSSFYQSPARLREIGGAFLSDTGVPLAFMLASELGRMVELLCGSVRLKTAIRWRRIFCVPGLIDAGNLVADLKTIRLLRA